MTSRRSQRRDSASPAVPPVSGELGLPAAPAAGGARNGRLRAVLLRWRQRRHHRKQQRRENPGNDIGKTVRANELNQQLRSQDYDRWRGSGF